MICFFPTSREQEGGVCRGRKAAMLQISSTPGLAGLHVLRELRRVYAFTALLQLLVLIFCSRHVLENSVDLPLTNSTLAKLRQTCIERNTVTDWGMNSIWGWRLLKILGNSLTPFCWILQYLDTIFFRRRIDRLHLLSCLGRVQNWERKNTLQYCTYTSESIHSWERILCLSVCR